MRSSKARPPHVAAAVGFSGRPHPPTEARQRYRVALALIRAREQAGEELSWLRAVPAEPGPELALLLADLGSRLAALVTWLSGRGVPAAQLAPLHDLAVRLQAAETAGLDSAGLRDEALAVLTRFTAEDPAGAGDPPAAGTFWKRHP